MRPEAAENSRLLEDALLGAKAVAAFTDNRLPLLLSIIAGTVDLISLRTLGLFTAHVTGNLVLAAATATRASPLNLTQTLAIPVFILAVAATWAIAQMLRTNGAILARQLLVVQFAILAAVLVFSITGKPSVQPRGLTAGVAAMMAVSAMACQYALIRLALPKVVSTAVMTGNLTNAVLWLMDVWCVDRSAEAAEAERLKSSLWLLGGFLVGCLIAAVAVALVADWAWSLPAALAALAILCVKPEPAR